MNPTEHCRLCSHQKVDLKTGITCGLTDKKPNFENSCPTISFSDQLKNKIIAINCEYEGIKRKSILTYFYSILILVISLSVIIGGWYFGKYVYDAGVLSTVPVIIIGVGFLLFTAAFGPLNFHLRDKNLAKQKKDKIDHILILYNMDDSININFGREIHGSQEVFSDLKLQTTK